MYEAVCILDVEHASMQRIYVDFASDSDSAASTSEMIVFLSHTFLDDGRLEHHGL
jgi:hypothetical protein